MKRKLSVFLGLVVCFSLLCSFNVFANNISVYVDNEFVQLTDATGAYVYPFIQNGTTYVPLRGISETLDCDVVWDGNNNNILIYKEMQSDNSVFRNNSDEIKLYVDNKLVELKDANGTVVKPFVKDGTTYVPLRGVSQVLGCWVRWDGQAKKVSVYMKECPPDGVTLSENKPYEVEDVETYYELDGNQLKMDGIFYNNALEFGCRYSEATALFNLNGKFDSVSMTVGSIENLDRELTLIFIVDGKIINTHTIAPNSAAKNISVALNKGLQLKITTKDRFVGIGAGNIIFWG